MSTSLELGSLTIEVCFKDIRNVHLGVYPPDGRVRISAPRHATLETVRLFAISKLPWIRQQQRKLREQEREPPREYLPRESHYLWGRRYLLQVVEAEAAPTVELKHRTMVLHVRPGTDTARRDAIVAEWYRSRIRTALPALLARWQPVVGVHANHVFVQRMKTRWGSCNHQAGTIRLNTELAKKPRECLEYILVHELVHLLEPTHNARFLELMNSFMPQWPALRAKLNRLPVREERWAY